MGYPMARNLLRAGHRVARDDDRGAAERADLDGFTRVERAGQRRRLRSLKDLDAAARAYQMCARLAPHDPRYQQILAQIAERQR